MFGLLDSVKRALDLKRSLDEENEIHNNVYGEKAVEGTSRYPGTPVRYVSDK